MLLNIIGFNISWFGLVLLGQIFIPFTLFWLGLHLYRCKFMTAEIKLIVTITLIGIVVDSALQFLGVLIFHGQLLIPIWLMTLWAAFAATIAHSLNFLSNSTLSQILIGFVFPPLSYIGGASLSSVELGYSTLITYSLLGVTWSGLMVLFFYLKRMYFMELQPNE